MSGIDLVPQGEVSYDDLNEAEQAAVRDAWGDRDSVLLTTLDFTRICPACGTPYAESPACHVNR